MFACRHLACLLAFSVTGINYGASSISSAAQNDAAAAYRSLVQLAAASSTPIAPVMDSTRRYPGVYTCIPYCNLGGGVLTLDAQGVSMLRREREVPEFEFASTITTPLPIICPRTRRPSSSS